MKKRILCGLLIFIHFISIEAQSTKEIYKQFLLPILEISNDKVIDMLRTSAIKNMSDINDKDIIPYKLFIETDKQNELNYDFYLFSLYRFPIDDIVKSENLGVLYIDNVPIYVTKGCNPDNLFVITNEKHVLNINVTMNEDAPIIGFDYAPFFFMYSQREINQINLSERYVGRLGFTPCH